jgi:CubicO group peptidase (beta-lactamase class C family)
MEMRAWSLSALVALTLSTTAVFADESGLGWRVDAVIDEAIASERIVGTVVIVARDGKIVYQRAAGLADREAKRPMREDTIFRLASTTKPIVSATALALVDAGRLHLDDPVSRWIPEFRPKLADGREPVITVHHLLTHTAGLGYGFLEPADGPYHRAGVSDGLAEPDLPLAENLRRIASVPLAFEPGTAWRYSLATDVLGEVVARAGGESLPDIVAWSVTEPLGMTDTAFRVIDVERLATPYVDAEPRPARMGEPHRLPFGSSALVYSPARALDPKVYPSGGAGMVGTARDYVRFLEALRTGGSPILEPETAREMTSNAIGEMGSPMLSEGWGFGLGVAVLKDPNPTGTPQSAGAWAWGGVYGNHFWVDPAVKLTVVVLTNTAVAGMAGAFPEALRAAVYAGD